MGNPQRDLLTRKNLLGCNLNASLFLLTAVKRKDNQKDSKKQ
jgi:hypothetical protein